MRSALTSFFVSGLSATCRVMMSARRKTVSRSGQYSTLRSRAFCRLSERDQAMTCRPKAWARLMTSRPIWPTPIDAERLAVDAVGFAEFFLVPFMGAQGGDVVGDAAVDGQQQREREFGDGDGVFAGAIGDVHAAGAGGLDVDGVDARAGAEDDGELVAGLDGVGGDLFAADDEDLARADELGKFLGFDGGVVGDVAAEFLESVEVVFGELVGDQNLHIDLPRGERTCGGE